MKKDIHPKYYPDAKIKCACGGVVAAGSTKQEIEVEICSSCHPFFSGKEKLIDIAGRVEKFRQKMAKAEIKKASKKPKAERKAKKQGKNVSGKK